jgi:hypothetical protein
MIVVKALVSLKLKTKVAVKKLALPHARPVGVLGTLCSVRPVPI